MKWLLAATLMLGLSTGVQAGSLAKEQFGAKRDASAQIPAPFGSYAKGCLAGAVQLPETGATWQAMRLSRNRNWGHPGTIDYIKSLSAAAAQQPGWNGLYIGDISQPRGGPMLTGHRSHQIGLDIDIWMRPADRLTLSRNTRENISSVSMRRAKGAFVNANWTQAHHNILKAAARDKRVARIFVFPGAKVQMCKDARGNKKWLKKIRPWWGHHYHFHVRLRCPSGTSGCTNQPEPSYPANDRFGCAQAQQWVDDILNPPPPDPNYKPKKRREYVLSDLPKQCSTVLRAR